MTTTTQPARDPALDIGQEQLIRLYRQMVAIRLFEERVNDLYTRALMPGLAHLYIGEEAVAVGVCEALRPDDYITSTHRRHGHCLTVLPVNERGRVRCGGPVCFLLRGP